MIYHWIQLCVVEIFISLWYIIGMTTVQKIEESVVHLSKPELDEFRSWFEKFDADMRNRQFEGGKNVDNE